MGWEKIEPKTGMDNRPKNRIVLSSHGYGRGDGRIFSLVIPAALAGAWDKFEHCSVAIGTEEHHGKVRISGDELGKYAITRRKNAIVVRFPALKGMKTAHEADAVRARFEGVDLTIDLPSWALMPVPTAARPRMPTEEELISIASRLRASRADEEKPAAEGGEEQRPAPVASPPQAAALGPHPEVRQVTKNGAALGHQPHAAQLREADRQTAEARKIPPSKPSETEPPPSWRNPKPGPTPAMNGKISLVGYMLEAAGKVINLKGADEINFVTLLHKNQHRAVIDMEFSARHPEETFDALQGKLAKAKAPIFIAREDGGYRFRWRENNA
jgi:hypothetical protein